ncbi:aminoacyl-tRNA hydrolase [Boudabousia tangfeifanii]|uniref:Peptidyl-tRNA hydrolase n=1 Tax=Boudabousia tangfeifanii TaxID=1912795 RepID=A0A1D9MKS4_9ACTO|nr:aminoacyl-tRNA hydrolase [Boudabousia tangfeifanii]AOZ72961.1 aminoacyl-tRNA hydrolase [Boudabousia tangfeifanii]
MSNEPWLVVGLGNPGPRYELTRHNIGHLVVDALADEMGESFNKHKARAKVASGRLGILPGGAPGPKVMAAKLDTYMNTSGPIVKALVDFYQIDPAHLLIVHDELDLPEHELRLKQSGGAAGHNGLKSINDSLGTKDYCRLRVGIGRPPGQMSTADFVLSNFPAKQLPQWSVTIAKAVDAISEVVTKGFLTAQQDLHSNK